MTQLTIDSEQFDQLILQRLPTLMRQNPQIQGLVLDLARQNFAERKETDDRFYQLLGELRRDREEQSRKWQEYTQEQNRKWEEYTQEQNRKWDEQNCKWDEQNRKWEEYNQEQNRKWDEQNCKWNEQNRKWEEYTQEQNLKWDEQNCKWEDAKREFDRMHEAIMAIAKKHDRSITALGARWGIKSESSFRNALVGILEKSFDVQVLNITDYDDEGVVFGRPDQIELDVIIKNGLLIICEIKSSISRSDMYTFERKVRFYEKHHQRQANRILVISPMVEAKAEPVAKKLGIEVYSDSMEVKEL
ncbi:hypothetical protein THII_3853 [Thioploca ingrica]|uniref:DUF3782 domain-containing protein n=1 Tax=Thioploca ingrica TaxID=40754 RepID=A0A090AQZ2_9GAMM|nr:hypothetical protein THII_3853 [Thioploca ingrica]